MEEKRVFGCVFDFGICDFLLEHLVNHRKGRVKKEDCVDELLFSL